MKIQMKIELSNGKDKHVSTFDEEELKLMIAALFDYWAVNNEDSYRVSHISDHLRYVYDCLKPDDDDYVTLYDGGDLYE